MASHSGIKTHIGFSESALDVAQKLGVKMDATIPLNLEVFPVPGDRIIVETEHGPIPFEVEHRNFWPGENSIDVTVMLGLCSDHNYGVSRNSPDRRRG